MPTIVKSICLSSAKRVNAGMSSSLIGTLVAISAVPALPGATNSSVTRGDWATFQNVLSHLLLPALGLGSYTTGLITRVTRSAMLDAPDLFG